MLLYAGQYSVKTSQGVETSCLCHLEYTVCSGQVLVDDVLLKRLAALERLLWIEIWVSEAVDGLLDEPACPIVFLKRLNGSEDLEHLAVQTPGGHSIPDSTTETII